jgi:CRISPR-associated endonuclease/helicase Cas3
MLRGVPRMSRFDAHIPPLSKSGRRWSPHDAIRASLPPRWRHEAHSAALAVGDGTLRSMDAESRDLAMWLIATHHGHGRSFFPAAPSDEERDGIQGLLGSVQAARGARLAAAFGPHGLAWLEAMLRLADCSASAHPGLHSPTNLEEE